MISLVRSITFYLVTWLCLSGFLVPFALVQAGHPCYPPVGKFCTYNQNQYGDASSPAGTILTNNFPTLFPNGITIGAGVYLNVSNILCSVLNLLAGILDAVLDLVFPTVDEVIAFLPQVGGIVGPLTEGIISPADAPVNSLAGNALALALNIALDANIAGFSATDLCLLADLYITKGPCAGLKVSAVLDIANQILGSTVPLPILGTAPLTIAANVDLCVANINNNFLASAASNGFLALPGLNLQAIVDVCLGLGLPAITADVDASLVVRGVGAGAPLSVQVHVGANIATFKAWKAGQYNLPASSPIPIAGPLLLPLPSVIGGLLNGVVSLVGHLLDVVLDDTLCLVNYLLNNRPLNAALVDIQACIILLLNPGLTVNALLAAGIPCHPQIVLAILADVRLNGVGFIPAPGQLVGIFANVRLAGGIDAKVLLEVALPILGLNVDADLCIAL